MKPVSPDAGTQQCPEGHAPSLLSHDGSINGPALVESDSPMLSANAGLDTAGSNAIRTERVGAPPIRWHWWVVGLAASLLAWAGLATLLGWL